MLVKRALSKELCKCIEKIYGIFNSEVFILLDCVLTDDIEEPEYSANTVLKRIEYMRIFENEYYHQEIDTIDEFLNRNGYSKEDIELLRIKRDSENKRYGRI